MKTEFRLLREHSLHLMTITTTDDPPIWAQAHPDVNRYAREQQWTRIAACILAEKLTGCPARETRFLLDEAGVPRGMAIPSAGWTRKLSLARCAPFHLAVAAETTIGCDILELSDRDERISRLILSDSERILVKPFFPPDFSAGWLTGLILSMKEAALKANGRSIDLPREQIAIDRFNRVKPVRRISDPDEWGEYSFRAQIINEETKTEGVLCHFGSIVLALAWSAKPVIDNSIDIYSFSSATGDQFA